MIAEHALDYTTYAPPLTVDDIRRDLDAHCCAHLDYPSKIVLWVHQWDYLTKEHRNLKPLYVVEKAEKAELDDVGLKVTMRPWRVSDGGEIWGVPVEVLEP